MTGLPVRAIFSSSGKLATEFHSPGFARRAFRGGNVRLKLDRIGARVGDGVNVGVSRSQAAVVSLRDFADHQTWVVSVPEVI